MSDAPPDDGGRLERLDELPLVGGFVAGLASFVGGYVLFFGLLTGTGEIVWQRGLVDVVRSVAQAFYNAFNVRTYQRQTVTVDNPDGTQETIIEIWQNSVTGVREVAQRQIVDGQIVNEQTRSGAMETSLVAPDMVYLLVPAVAVLAAGIVLGYRVVDLETDDPNAIAIQSVAGGAAMAAGFLVLSLGLTFVLVRTGQNAVLHPSRIDAILYGIAYPLVGGTASIAFGQVLQSRSLDGDGQAAEVGGERDEQTGE